MFFSNPRANAQRRISKGARRTREELAFLPALLEVIETPVSPVATATSLCLVAVACAALLWSCVAHLDIVAVAPGKIVPQGRVKTIQPLETARVGAILVDDGAHVNAGDVLVELEAVDVAADIATAKTDLAHAMLEAEEARLVMLPRTDVLEENFMVLPQDTDILLRHSFFNQALSERAKLNATLNGYKADIDDKRAALASAAIAKSSAEAAIPLLQQREEIYAALVEENLGHVPDLLTAKEQLLEKTSARDSADQSIVQSEAQIRSLERKSEEAIAASLADAMDRRVKALAKIENLRADLAKHEKRLANRHLVAPVAGTVEGVKTHTLGAVVTVADTLMTVVPDDTPLEIEASISNDDIGFVAEGQEAEVKVEAFPFTRYGLVKAVVTRVSTDAVADKPVTTPPPPSEGRSGGQSQSSAGNGGIAPDPLGATQLYYTTRLKLLATTIATEHGAQKLQPGMKVNAEIKTGERRVIEFLLSPVMQTIASAGHER